MANYVPPGPTKEELQLIADRAFKANPRNYVRQVYDDDPSVLADVTGSSPIIDAIRQTAPENINATPLGKWIGGLFPADAKPESFLGQVKSGLLNVPLGGYSQDYLSGFDQARANDAQLERETVRIGKVPVPGGGEKPASGFRESAAQLGSVAAADLMTDGLRNIWWFLNAPQALSSVAVLSALHGASQDFKTPDDKGPLLRNRGMRLAATVPAWIGTSLAVGNFGRQPGFKAAVPSEVDPTVTADPLAELGTRFFLGRSGAMLPYEDFVKERPDVSRSEYEAYKAYLFGNTLPIKATMEGINGPEVTFLGKSVPVVTGILPAAAAALGAGAGLRMAGGRLAKTGALNEASELRKKMDAADAKLRELKNKPKVKESDLARAQLERGNAYTNYQNVQDVIDKELLQQSLLYSSLGLGGAGIAGGTLESIRRALKGQAEVEPDPIAQIPAA